MNKKAFSLVELIVSITILVILSSISFISYNSYLTKARDTQRKSDISYVSSALKSYKQQKGSYPNPGNAFYIIYNGESNILANQGELNTQIQLPTLNELPLDPKIGKPYIYSTTKNHGEYQLAFTLENSGLPTAMINGDYKSVSIDILPSIVLAINTGNNVDISNTSQNAFVLNGQTKNLPYTFKDSYSPQVSIASFGDLKNLITDLKSENLYWQNSDYRNCDEIKQAGKNLSGVTEYQTLNNSGVLVDVTCSF